MADPPAYPPELDDRVTQFSVDLALQPGRRVVIRDGLISEIVEASRPLPAGIKVINASGQTLIPGLIDAHVHLMFDSGPYLLTRAPHLMR